MCCDVTAMCCGVTSIYPLYHDSSSISVIALSRINADLIAAILSQKTMGLSSVIVVPP